MSEGAVTSTSAVAKSRAKHDDSASLRKVRYKHEELKDLIENLADKLSAVKHDQENEFLSAYRVHMLNVQLELKELGGKVAKAEEFLQDDSEVSKLEEECKWFRDETNRLQLNVTQMTNDMAQMRSRLTALNEQKSYLSDQLKQTMKRSRVLQTEVDIINQRELGNRSVTSSVKNGVGKLDGGPSYDGSSVMSGGYPGGGGGGNGDQLGPLVSSGQQQHQQQQPRMNRMNRGQSTGALPPPQAQQTQSKGGKKSLGSSASEAAMLKHHVGHHGGGSGGSIRNMNSSKMTSKIHEEEVIRAALRSGHSRGASRGGLGDSSGGFVAALDTLVPAATSKKNKKGGIGAFGAPRGSAEAFLHELQDLEESKSDLEIKLEQYVGHVFNRVLERKARLAAQVAGRSKRQVTSSSQAGAGDGMEMEMEGGTVDPVSITASQILSDTAHDPRGLTGLGLHYFTESDRFQCMCLLLSDPTVFSQVVEEMQRRSNYQ